MNTQSASCGEQTKGAWGKGQPMAKQVASDANQLVPGKGQPMVSMEKLLSLREVSEFLGVSQKSVTRGVALGRYPKPVRCGKLLRWSPKVWAAFISGESL